MSSGPSHTKFGFRRFHHFMTSCRARRQLRALQYHSIVSAAVCQHGSMMDVRASLVPLILVALVACAEGSTGRPAGEAFQRVTLRGRGEVAHATTALAPPLDHVASGTQAQPNPTGDADEGVHLETWLNTAMAGPPSSSSTEAPLRGAWPADAGPISALWTGSLTPTTAGERGVAPRGRQLRCCCFAPLRCSTDLPPSACLWVWVCVVPAPLCRSLTLESQRWDSI